MNPTDRTWPLVGLVIVFAIAGVALTSPVAAQDTNNGTATGNETTMATGNGNASIAASPDTAGETANHSVNVTLDEELATDLTYIRINYTGSNASIAGVPDNVQSATLGGQDVAANITPSTRIASQTVLNLSFDLNESLQPQAGDEFAMVYEAGNPPEPDTYDVDMVIAAGDANTTRTAELNITGNQTTTTAGNDTNPSITADPDSAGATANHSINLTLDEGMATNLTYIRINYTGSNASIAGAPDGVQSATLGGEDVAANVTPSTRLVDQTVLNLSFDLNESLQPQAGDEFAMVYEAGNPPEPDTYEIGMRIAAGETNTSRTAELNITESQATTTTSMGMTTGENTTGKTTATEAETTEAETTEAETTEEETTEEAAATEEPVGEETTTSSGNGPGFTAVAALVGVLAAALLATRRR